MKKFLLLFVIALAGVTTQAQEIKWISFQEAIKAQKKDPKPIFMDVYTNWCGPCKMLDKNTFSDPSVINHINAQFHAVKFNAEGNENIEFLGNKFTNPKYNASITGRNSMHEFTDYLKILGYPSMVIINNKGKVTKTIVGYKTADQLIEETK